MLLFINSLVCFFKNFFLFIWFSFFLGHVFGMCGKIIIQCHGISDMSQFGLGSANSHWGYSSASYSPYLTGSGLSTCGTASAAQFNNPALGFSCSSTDQAATQDFTNNARECLPSKWIC